MKRFFLIGISLLFFTAFICAQEQTHVIQKGETLYSLARMYSVSVDAICKANGISDPAKIKIGQKINIPSNISVQNTTADIVITQKKADYSEYTVQNGDTFYSLAKKSGMSVADFLSYNSLPSNATLKSGQKLLLPANGLAEKPQTNTFTPQEQKNNPVIALPDPRSYENRKIDANIIWPVKPIEIAYATGKIFSVVLTTRQNEKVNAVKSGLVIFSGMYRGFGQVVFVHSQSTGHISVYSGLDTLNVAKGDKINFGDAIGTVGIDTITNKPQLNFMIFFNGKPIDPATVPRG